MIEQFINFVIRPPRAVYDPDQYLWEKDFTLAGRAYKREDLELENERGQILKCSHYLPSILPGDSSLPCVVYCHGNSGCRADANEAAVVLLPTNITVFTLDFSGSGLSDGNYVSLGWHEKDDLRVVVTYLKTKKHVSCIGLWGRSMGAVTSLLYGSEDPSISGMVLDSAFTNLFDLMMELVDVYKIRLPKFTVKMAMQIMRRGIQKRAEFDIRKLNSVQVASKTLIPALFGHANGDKFIQPHHSDIIFKLYAGDKNIIKFDGDHNTSRPQFYYDAVSKFFYNTLHPPQVSSVWSNKIEECHGLKDFRVSAGMNEGDKNIIKFDGDHNTSRPQFYYDAVSKFFYNTLHPPQVSSVWSNKIEECHGLKDFRVSAGMNEMLLYEILSNLRIASSDVASSSSALPNFSTAKSVADIFCEIAPALGTNMQEMISNDGICTAEQYFQDNINESCEECCSHASSNRESFGRCSSLGVSDFADDVDSSNNDQRSPGMLSTSTKRYLGKSPKVKKKACEEKVPPSALKKSRSKKYERFGAFGKLLRHSILKRARVGHRKPCL